MNLLLIDTEADTRDMIRFGLEADLNIHTVDAENCDSAIAKLEQYRANSEALEILKKANAEASAVSALEGKTHFDAIFCTFEADVSKIVTWLRDKGDRAALIVWNKSGAKNVMGQGGSRIHSVISEGDVVVELKEELRRLMSERGITTVRPKTNTLDDIYCPIRTPLLIKVSPLRSDIYLRLSEKKYLKVFPEGETFDRKDLQKYYEEKGVEYLFLKKDETSEFIGKFQKDLDSLMAKPEITIEEADEASSDAHETVQELLQRTGFTEEVKEVARSAVMVTVKSMGEQPELMQILERLKNEKDRYITSHSMLTAHLACAISAGMTWNSSATYEKLTLAAFMHDVTLTNNNLAEIQSLEELQERGAEFSEEEQKAFRNHPMDASNLVRQMKQIPADVDVIINQHHERVDGTGFPRGLMHTHIGHLSCVFIIGHDLARFMLANKRTEGILEEFVATHKDRYKKGNFRKVLDSIVKENITEDEFI